jgi:putative transposase
MSRPLRIEFPGAIYHVTSRGDRREAIYRDDADRLAYLDVLAQALERFDAEVLAYCLMGNHYHLVLHTRAANLSRLMRHLNGVYTQRFNRRHGLVGHLLQGRFKAILVDRDAYLLALCRYVERNPVAAHLVVRASDWPWSSARAHLLQTPAPEWLDCDGLHGYLLARPVRSRTDRVRAAAIYAKMLEEDDDLALWSDGLRQQVFLGDEAFVQQMLERSTAAEGPVRGHAARVKADGVPQRQRRKPAVPPPPPKATDSIHEKAAALHTAYTQAGFTMTSLARHWGLSVSRVSRLIARAEELMRAVKRQDLTPSSKGKT